MRSALIRLACAVVALMIVPAMLKAQSEASRNAAAPGRQGAVQVSGQVRTAGPQELVAGKSLTVTAAISKAGGFTEWANVRRVMVTRQAKDGRTEKFEVDVRKVIETGDSKFDPVLRDGDAIYVRSAGCRLFK
jgi:protein involved in polysaccharide export with SLBB domain